MTPKIQHFKETERIKPELDAYRMYYCSNLEIVHLHLLPGEEIGLHVNPADVIFNIMQGSATIVTENSQILADTFDVIEIPAGLERGMKNESTADLRVLVIKRLVS